MDWTVRYYIYQSEVWEDRKNMAQGSNDNGAVAYASRKEAMWMDMAAGAATKFHAINPSYKSAI